MTNMINCFYMAYLVCFMFTDPFPVDVIQENYVRNVRNCIFSVVYPTPFKSRVRLVAVSKVGYCFFIPL